MDCERTAWTISLKYHGGLISCQPVIKDWCYQDSKMLGFWLLLTLIASFLVFFFFYFCFIILSFSNQEPQIYSFITLNSHPLQSACLRVLWCLLTGVVVIEPCLSRAYHLSDTPLIFLNVSTSQFWCLLLYLIVLSPFFYILSIIQLHVDHNLIKST
jgi:hypothetical protein